MLQRALMPDIDKQAFSHLLNIGSIGKALSCWMNIKYMSLSITFKPHGMPACSRAREPHNLRASWAGGPAWARTLPARAQSKPRAGVSL